MFNLIKNLNVCSNDKDHLIAETIGKYPHIVYERKPFGTKIRSDLNNLESHNKIRYYESSDYLIECRHYSNSPNPTCTIIKKKQGQSLIPNLNRIK